jgi:hypothetical protein
VLPGEPWGVRWLPDFGTAVVPAPPEVEHASAKVVVSARDMRIFRRV